MRRVIQAIRAARKMFRSFIPPRCAPKPDHEYAAMVKAEQKRQRKLQRNRSLQHDQYER